MFDDILKLSQQPKSAKHFFGSIVIASANGGHTKLVIDGQQRITTISLLLLAAIRAVKDQSMEIKSSSSINNAIDNYLRSQFSKEANGRKIKLMPIIRDRIAYDKLFDYCINDAEVELDEASKVTINFHYFYNCIERNKDVLSFDLLLQAIENLTVIAIDLDRDDDAQLIFESLNSTGLDLTEADKIRNYMFMSLTKEEQRYCFKEYWQKIENATAKDPTNFLHDYLTIQNTHKKRTRKSEIYIGWKSYMEGNNRQLDRKEEFKKMLHFVRYYQQYSEAKLSTKKLSEKIANIGHLQTDVVSVFFTEFLEYADRSQLSDDEIFKVIDFVECYLVRRAACRQFSSGLSDVFSGLHKETIRLLKDKSLSYSKLMAYNLLGRKGKQGEWPRDTEFSYALKSNDAYNLAKPALRLILERLDNDMPGEHTTVVADLQNKLSKIDHIMPKTLTENWKAMLGPDYVEIHNQYFNSLANLAIIGSLNKYSKKDFAIKCNGDESATKDNYGYFFSKYRLTRSIASHKQWTRDELEQRAQCIVDTLLQIYPLPKIDFALQLESISSDNVLLSDTEFDPTGGISIKAYRLFGREDAVSSWKEMYVDVIRALYQEHGPKMGLKNKPHDALEKSHRQTRWVKIDEEKYVNTELKPKEQIIKLRDMFERCNLECSELEFILSPNKGQSRSADQLALPVSEAPLENESSDIKAPVQEESLNDYDSKSPDAPASSSELVEVFLSNASFNPEGNKLLDYRLFGYGRDYYSKFYEVSKRFGWKDMFIQVANAVWDMDEHKEQMDKLFANEVFPYKLTKASNPDHCRKIADNKYIYNTISSSNVVKALHKLFEACGIDKQELTFICKQKANKSPQDS